ncbi:MAG: TonB-dependent receptor [Prolixibacteraceae bacterium]|nr:TonB-dependent receptor [Prolixibacteraceae bacterium]
MKTKLVFFLLWLVFLTATVSIEASGKKVGGIVVDGNHLQLPGALVSCSEQQTITDANGRFNINIETENQLLIVSKEGFSSVFVKAEVLINDTVVLHPAFQKKVTLLNQGKKADEISEAVSFIDGDKMKNLPGTNRFNQLSGRLPGLLVMQTDGQPGWEENLISIRGRNSFGTIISEPVILLDGHEADLTQLDAYDIESITVLKDAAATAMYGLRAANGIILVNTKRGEKGKVKVSFNNQTAVAMPVKFPAMLDAAAYAELYNEAAVNDGLSPVYSNTDIEAYRNGSDLVAYPNNNYFNDYFSKSSVQTRNNLNLSGGDDFALYHVSLGHTSNSGLLNTEDSENKYNTNTSYETFNVHANVDIKVNDRLTVFADIKAKKEKRTLPGAYNSSGVSGIIADVLGTPSNAYPIFLTTDSLGGTPDYRNNIYGQLNRSGYSLWERYYLSGNVDFEYDLNVIEGLSLIGSAGYNNFGNQIINRSKSFAVYQSQADGSGGVVVNKIGDDTPMKNESTKSGMIRFYHAELGFGLDKTFGSSSLNAKLLAENRMTERDIARVPQWKRGLKGRVDYNLNSKYLLGFAFAYQGSEQFPKEDRYGFFPALSLGWVLSNENFLKDATFLNYLKLRGSAGITGMDFDSFYSDAYFAYIDQFAEGGTYPFGTSLGNKAPRFTEQADANDLITWAKSKKLNVGFDAALAGNKLSLTADYFTEKTSDLLVGGTPGVIGIGYLYPQGVVENKGVEGMITWKQKVGNNFEYFLSANVTYAKNKIVEQNEEAREYEWQYRTGHEIGSLFGYQFDGFFTENDDISAYPDQSSIGEVIPGSLRYKDLNGDDMIDERDETYLGNGEFPELWYGFSGGLTCGGFDFNFQFSGVANRMVQYTGDLAYAFNNGKGSANEWHLERWQPGDGQNATYPSVSLSKFQNNKATSSFWIHDAGFLRLQSVELGYSLPKKTATKIGLEKVRLFVTGNNLMTWSNVKWIDPAGNGNGTNYPVARTFSGGLNLTF